jgi:hypothetical protein
MRMIPFNMFLVVLIKISFDSCSFLFLVLDIEEFRVFFKNYSVNIADYFQKYHFRIASNVKDAS